MKANAIPNTTCKLVIQKPPLFIVFCIVVWGVSLLLAFTHHLPMGDIDNISAITGP